MNNIPDWVVFHLPHEFELSICFTPPPSVRVTIIIGNKP